MPRAVTQTTNVESLQRAVRRQRKQIERMNAWLKLSEAALAERVEQIKQLGHDREEAVGEAANARTLANAYREKSYVAMSERDALLAYSIALASRYVGAKLDAQQFTFPQAQEWLRNEERARAQMLQAAAANARAASNVREERAYVASPAEQEAA